MSNEYSVQSIVSLTYSTMVMDRTLFVSVISAETYRLRFDYEMRVFPSFPLSPILPKKHNDVKIT